MLRKASADLGPAGFTAALRAEHEALGAFISLLQAEQEVLVHGDADRLAEMAPDKSRQIEQLARLGEQRNRYLTEQQLGVDARGMEAWFESQRGPETADARSTWRELLRRAHTARELNQSNGILIENRMQQNRMKLAVLQAAVSNQGVYGADGQLGSLATTRNLGAI